MKVCTACGVEYPDDVLFCQRDGTTLRSADPSRDLVGQVIADRYHVTRKLGEGGMGQVYLAEHVKMGRRCAIKIMSAGMSNDPDAVSRFNREAANASRINHPNVCAIYDFGETSDHIIYLAMEFIEGRSLTDLLREAGPLSLPRAANILTQCADALHAAHDLGIVHRDLKPDNIMVITTRGKDVVKVVDFGIAKATGADSAGQKVTKTGLVVGTPEYMSPEQLSGDTLDGRSDIYSLALVFYRMITGTLPFKADSAQETMIKRLTDEPLPLDQARPGARYPQGLQEIMNRALARWPGERYTSASDFAHDVTAICGSVTGKVDLEGATQTVEAAGHKAGAGTVPQTRVDTAAVGAKQRAAVAGAAAAAKKPATQPRKSPALAIGIGATLLALGVGAFAFKDRILHGGAAAGDSTAPGAGARPDSTLALVLTHQDSVDQGLIPPPRSAGTGGAGGPVVKPARDTAVIRPPATIPASGGGVTPPKRDDATIDAALNAIQDSIIDVPAERGALRSRAEALFNDAGVSTTLRGKAAATIGQAYLEDKNSAKAREWFVKAAALDSKLQKYVDNLDKNAN